jgi:transposase
MCFYFGKQYNLEFRMQNDELVIDQGQNASHLAKNLDISLSTLKNWIKSYNDKKE